MQAVAFGCGHWSDPEVLITVDLGHSLLTIPRLQIPELLDMLSQIHSETADKVCEGTGRRR